MYNTQTEISNPRVFLVRSFEGMREHIREDSSRFIELLSENGTTIFEEKEKLNITELNELFEQRVKIEEEAKKRFELFIEKKSNDFK